MSLIRSLETKESRHGKRVYSRFFLPEGISLSLLNLDPIAISAPSSVIELHKVTKKLGSQVPSASRKASRSAFEELFQPSLMAAPYPRLCSKTISFALSLCCEAILTVLSVEPSLATTISIESHFGYYCIQYFRAASVRKIILSMLCSSFRAGMTISNFIY